jgi:hypothetical protein
MGKHHWKRSVRRIFGVNSIVQLARIGKPSLYH